MRLLFATTESLDRHEAPCYRILRYSCALSCLGHSVTLLHRGGGSPVIGDAAKCLKLHPVPWVPLRGWGRVFPIVFAACLARQLATNRYDWLHLRITPHWPVVHVLERARVPMSVEHIEDFLPSRRLRRFGKRIRLAFTNSEKCGRLLHEEFGLAKERIVSKPEGIEPSVFLRATDRAAVRARFGLDPEAFLIAHASSFRWHHDFDTILEAVRRFNCPAQIAFCGAGPRSDEVRRKVYGLGVSARFLGALPQSQLALVLSAADACVDALMKPVVANGNLRASKLWEYMASGVPTVETIDPTLPLPAWAAECLFLVPAEDPGALYDILWQTKAAGRAAAEKAEKARRWVLENKTWEVVTRHAVAAIERVLREDR